MALRERSMEKSSTVKKFMIISVIVACSPTFSFAILAQAEVTGGKI